MEYRIYELLGVEYYKKFVLFIWNLYSVMLQRYNMLRIDKILNKKYKGEKSS